MARVLLLSLTTTEERHGELDVTRMSKNVALVQFLLLLILVSTSCKLSSHFHSFWNFRILSKWQNVARESNLIVLFVLLALFKGELCARNKAIESSSVLHSN